MSSNNAWNGTITTTSLTYYAPMNIPALTTLYTADPDCANRWMLSPDTTNGSRVYSFGPEGNGNLPVDPRYESCLPFSQREPRFSPGLCPSGHEFAAMTEIRVSAASKTIWEALCCRSGMKKGPYWCSSTFSTPLPAFALLTVQTTQNENATVYDHITTTTLSNGIVRTSTLSNLTTITTGVAIAKPWFIAWESKDLSQFPSSYATSLASKIGVTLSGMATPASSSSLPRQTDLPPSNPSMSTGAKAGIGVGAVVGAALLLGALTILFLRRRKKYAPAAVEEEEEDMGVAEMEDQDRELADRKWFVGGQWRNEVRTEEKQHELDSKTVHVVPGPPAELDGEDRQTNVHPEAH
ncbi:hypothetical protein BKA66DRAFT_570433 [Pyrenochaeta sp. MPI-SDFR-AT-0127]|nr:hypothetical protein BKA66DRAFT_570433 [Pyrenochaeta sp. MPI-SDFR-AT-0127]